MSTDPKRLAAEAAAELKARTGIETFDVAMVLGSGWAPAAELLGDVVAEVPAAEIPGFRAPSVAGHVATLRVVAVPGDVPRHALVLGARTHYYEGHGVASVVHGVRTAAAAGCSTLVLTNGCGSLNTDWGPGTAVLISDHLNMTGATPLVGATFVDLTDLYSKRLREVCRTVQPDLPEGVYVQLSGPQYETPAEIRMYGRLGADLVGMSTALEAIAAREAGMEILGISLVTNLAAGITGEPLDHAEVLEAGRAAAQRVGSMLADVVRKL
ncbi:purine-nucleoside phosphorylase [Spongisporangium articulatum]|uniref:Purine nucleoside phosphorylase n=1 Tax=Spongisporangium articulatum TaxID=3362603 RepID=A0ABW8AQU3_9ACTN